MHIRCPHCRNAIELVDDGNLEEVHCPSCGSSLCLVNVESSATYRPESKETIGHFTLDERLGLGAFGTVWKARDIELDRVVAIKIPRKGQLNAAESEKFLREARTAAQLKHPNIVSVHEVGKEEETLYIVSDLVDGITLTDWLTGQLPTPREAVQLCVKISDALHHAHELGVIHRDLKPGNILLDRSNEPYLTDFGLAKREAASEITMTLDGQILGTPAYMPPEQARGEGHHVDRRADIYSLGVVLFELLTGERPFRGNSRMLIHQLLTEEAPSPRRLNATLPKDLETICLRCLEKEPDRRYATAAELKDELQRWLNGEAIQSRPISRMERGWRWCKRKPVIAGLTAMFLLSVSTGTAVSSYFAIEAGCKAAELSNSLELEKKLVSEKSALVDEKEGLIVELETANSVAQASQHDAEQRAAALESVLKFFQEKILAAGRPKGEKGGLGIDVPISDAIDAAVPTISESLSEQPEVEDAIRFSLAETYLILGKFQAASDQFKIVEKIRADRLGIDHPDYFEVVAAQIETLWKSGRTQEAMSMAQAVIDSAKNQLGANHATTQVLRALIARLYSEMGNDVAALQELRSLEQAGVPAAELSELFDALKKDRSPEEKVQYSKDVLERTRDVYGSQHPQTLVAINNLAVELGHAGRGQEALKYFEQVVELAKEIQGVNHPSTFTYMNNLASQYEAAERNVEAMQLFDEILRIGSATLGNDHPKLFVPATHVAELLARQGRVAESIAYLEQLLPRMKETLGSNHPLLIAEQYLLAKKYRTVGRIREAIPLEESWHFERIETLRKDALSEKDLASALVTYGENLTQQHKFVLAEPPLREAIQIYERVLPADIKLDYARLYLGESLSGQEKYEEAAEFLNLGFEGLLEHKDQLSRFTSLELGQAALKLVDLYERWNKPEQVQQWKEKAKSLDEAIARAETLRDQAVEESQEGHLLKAIALYEQADELAGGKSNELLARLYARTQQWERAFTAYGLAFPPEASWQELCIAYRIGDQDVYEQFRKTLLADYFNVRLGWQYRQKLQMSLLRPVPEELKPAIQFLTAVNENQKGNAASQAIVGKAKYRLGEFRDWYAALPEESPMRSGQELLVAMTDFQQTPTIEHRLHLEENIESSRLQATENFYQNLTKNTCFDYIDRMAWVHEAQRVLAAHDEHANWKEEWPDETIDLLHLDEQVAKLKADAEKLMEANRLEDAIASYEKLELLPGRSAYASLRDLYARTFQHDKVRSLMQQERYQNRESWQEAFVNFQIGDREKYRAIRRNLLTKVDLSNKENLASMDFRIAILEPLESDLHAPIRELAKRNSESDQPWLRVKVGKAMYRLGEFKSWYQSLPEDSSLRNGQELLLAITNFQSDANVENRSKLIELVEKEEHAIGNLVKDGVLGKYWFNYSEQKAWIEESKSVLEIKQSNPSNAESGPK